MKWLGGHKSLAFKYLYMFPNAHLKPRLRTPMFDKYDRHSNPITHLKRYCNQLRGAGVKRNCSWLVLVITLLMFH